MKITRNKIKRKHKGILTMYNKPVNTLQLTCNWHVISSWCGKELWETVYGKPKGHYYESAKEKLNIRSVNQSSDIISLIFSMSYSHTLSITLKYIVYLFVSIYLLIYLHIYIHVYVSFFLFLIRWFFTNVEI